MERIDGDTDIPPRVSPTSQDAPAMLSFRMRQKNAEFYFVSYPAEDLLRRVRFVSRFYGERGETVGGGETRREPDEVERFVRAVERSSGAF